MKKSNKKLSEAINIVILLVLLLSACTQASTAESATLIPEATITEGSSLKATEQTATEAPTQLPAITGETCGEFFYEYSYDELYEKWMAWKKTYIIEDPDGNGLRVVGWDDQGTTPSEGQAYAMLFAAIYDDQSTFDALLEFVQGHRNDQNLMVWAVTRAGEPKDGDTSSASDADADIGLALSMASARWAYHTDPAVEYLINFSQESFVIHDEYGLVMKPGSDWGDNLQQIAPDYFSPGHYDIFSIVTGDRLWEEAIHANDTHLDLLYKKTESPLVPDWATFTGDPVPGRPYVYGWNAIRFAFRQGLAAQRFCHEPSLAALERFNTFFEELGPANVQAEYSLDGKEFKSYQLATFTCPVLGAAVFSDNQQYREEALHTCITTSDGGYMDAAMQLLYLSFSYGLIQYPLPKQ